MSNPAKNPHTSLLVKLGSIAVHAEEAISEKGHHFDISALKSLLNDHEVKQWLSEMDALALIPKKR